MSNFSGIKKSAKPFQPQGSGAPDVGIVRNVAGGYEPVNYVEVKKASEPVLDTTPTPRTDGKGERDLGVNVDRIDRDGSAKYLDPQLIQRIAELANGGNERAKKALEELLALAAEKSAGALTLVKSAGEAVSVFVPILHKNSDLHEVHGVIAEEVPDKSGEILDYASSEPHFRKWAAEAAERTLGAGLPVSFGNVRSQHSAEAVGKLTSINFDAKNKRIPVVAKIVDSEAWAKVLAGVYTGFSIGGKYLDKWQDGRFTRYTALPAEVSLVDNPCMDGARFTMVKDAPSADMGKLNATIAALSKRVDEILKAQGVTSPELSPTNFKNVSEWREAIAKAELAKALANGKPPEFEGGNSKSGFKPIGTGERVPDGAAKHYVDLDERKPFQPRG